MVWGAFARQSFAGERSKECIGEAAWRFSWRNLTANFAKAGDLPVMTAPIGDRAIVAMAWQGSPQIWQGHANPASGGALRRSSRSRTGREGEFLCLIGGKREGEIVPGKIANKPAGCSRGEVQPVR